MSICEPVHRVLQGVPLRVKKRTNGDNDGIDRDPQFLSAIQACAVALRRLADYELDSSLHSRMHALGEGKEFLSQAEHEELLALVAFAHRVQLRNWKPVWPWTIYGRCSLACCLTHERAPEPLRDAVVRRAGHRKNHSV